MYDYYVAYAKPFGLQEHIRLSTEVVSVDQSKDYDLSGQWVVTVRGPSGKLGSEVFDAVIVCSGIYISGYIPDYPGLDEFKGQILHSCQFKRGVDFKDQTVLIVGKNLINYPVLGLPGKVVNTFAFS